MWFDNKTINMFLFFTNLKKMFNKLISIVWKYLNKFYAIKTVTKIFQLILFTLNLVTKWSFESSRIFNS